MTSSTLASALAVLGLVTGIGLLGYLVGRDVDRSARLGRDNWQRPGGYPVDPARPDRLHAAPTPATATAAPTAALPNQDRLRGTLPAASDLRFGTLVRWTSASAPQPKPICVPRAR
ncbi:hypothetical protein E6W39_16290 [Kitasatospora acidiphila]|uniref:Uncharacterized protein n=1 Tax=Kitasatospora acidiphila TaxID=2567942 RepID=A0A540W3A7_9ACTN|nr:hypothetical protein [Kitasatospora acidiphila]TQF03505.1 hypothetical protein E6W39_16290 [Kitasatospora acidiphila]